MPSASISHVWIRRISSTGVESRRGSAALDGWSRDRNLVGLVFAGLLRCNQREQRRGGDVRCRERAHEQNAAVAHGRTRSSEESVNSRHGVFEPRLR